MDTHDLFDGAIHLPKSGEDEIEIDETKPIPDKMEIVVSEDSQLTFLQAVHSFNLPRPAMIALQYKKRRGGTNPKAKNPLGSKLKDYEKIEVVELSGFQGRGVTRAALKELIEGINLMPNVKMLKLKNNGLTDDFVEEIEQIFEMEKLKSIDLSCNNFIKVGDVIGQKMKEKIKHIQFLDMTLNFIPNEGNISLYYGLQK